MASLNEAVSSYATMLAHASPTGMVPTNTGRGKSCTQMMPHTDHTPPDINLALTVPQMGAMLSSLGRGDSSIIPHATLTTYLSLAGTDAASASESSAAPQTGLVSNDTGGGNYFCHTPHHTDHTPNR
jgi:hypothetical protein